jgi:CheY-like chemotaxis protein
MDAKVILLVEDNPDDAVLTLRAFKKCKIQGRIVVVRDGQEALDYLFAQGAYADRTVDDLPNLVLLDIKLPKIDGLEVLRRLRSHTATRLLPVVILTSSDEATDIEKSYQYCANSFIRKPVDFLQFTKTVEHMGVYWLSLNVPPPSVQAG